jgi:hypothetical protein
MIIPSAIAHADMKWFDWISNYPPDVPLIFDFPARNVVSDESCGLIMNVFTELIQTAVEKDNDVRRSPPLNLFTTLPKNFSRSISRVGPLVEFLNKIENILLWHVPTGQSPHHSLP